MVPSRSPQPIYLLLLWLLVCLVQAAFTPLDPDETYYWMYAGQLDWGYYDHPPAVALLVALGRDWLPGPLGVRFGHVLVSALTMWALWHLLGRPRGKLLWLAAGLAFAQPMLNVYGFIATPDGPLLLFSVLYLLAYRRFLEVPNWWRGAVWGLTMAGLLYSKYHGLVLILFSVLPHLGWLLRRPGAWLAALGGALLYAPHLYWQYANDFPSFRYHLQGRNDPYQLKYTTEYLLNQLLIFSPLLAWYYGKTLWKVAVPGDRFAQVCYWLVLGFAGFFLYMTSKGKTEAQWTALLVFPLLYLTFRAARDRFPTWQPGIWRMSWVTILLLSLARIVLMLPRDWLPFQKPFDHEPWALELAEKAGDRPVIFENSYRLASSYEFYTGQPAWTFTDVEYRRNQYDLWMNDSTFHNRPVLLAGQRKWAYPGTDTVRIFRGFMKALPVERFQAARALRLEARLPDTLVAGRSYPVAVTATLPVEAGIPSLELFGELPFSLHLTVHDQQTGDLISVPVEGFSARPRAGNQLVPHSVGVQRIGVGEPVLLYQGPVRIPDVPPGEAEIELGLAYPGMPPIREMMGKQGVLVR